MPLHNLTRFPRLEFIGAPTPLEYLPRFSDYLGREIFIKRDDVTPWQWAAINYEAGISRSRCSARRCRYADYCRGDPV